MAVTSNQLIIKRATSGSAGSRRAYPVDADVVLYQGTAAFIDASTGNATPLIGADGVNLFAGIVVAEKNNSGTNYGGAAGDETVEVYGEGEFLLPFTGLTAENFGATVYASDNYTFTLTATDNAKAGEIVQVVSATAAWVRINRTHI